jgi:hypothetical protein
MGAGNGTVMCCTPIGLAARDVEEARAAAAMDACLAHGHPAAAPASAGLCAALLALRRGGDPLAAARAEAQDQPELERALELAARGERDELAALASGPAAGACWTTLAIGLCAYAWVGDYEPGVTCVGSEPDSNPPSTIFSPSSSHPSRQRVRVRSRRECSRRGLPSGSPAGR